MQSTLGHINCPACDAARHVLKTALPCTLLCPEAAERYIESRQFLQKKKSDYVSARTLKDMKEYSRALTRFFERLQLDQVHIGHIREYQRARASGELGPKHREINPNKINQEAAFLIQI